MLGDQGGERGVKRKLKMLHHVVDALRRCNEYGAVTANSEEAVRLLQSVVTSS